MADIGNIAALNAYQNNPYVKNLSANTKGTGGFGGVDQKVGGFTPKENFQATNTSNNPFGVARYGDGSLNSGGYGLAFGTESTGVHGNSDAVGKKLQLVG